MYTQDVKCISYYGSQIKVWNLLVYGIVCVQKGMK
jgi:hypothetical protein